MRFGRMSAAEAAAARKDLGLSLPTPFGSQGGTETQLQASADFRLSVDFVATAPNLLATASATFEASSSGASGIACLMRLDAYNITVGGAAFAQSSQAALTHNGLGINGALTRPLALSSLNVGQTYRLWLMAWVGNTSVAIYPRNMIIGGVNL